MRRLIAVLLLVLVVVVVLVVLNFRLERVIESGGRIVVRRSQGGALPCVTLNWDIYSDNSKTATLSFIDWGTCDHGETKTHSVYVFNSGSVPFVLGLSTENWVPSNASDYIHLSWGYDGDAVQPNMGIVVTFTLKVDSNITGIDTFSFDIVLTVTQA